MKYLFTIDDFMVAFISALGYGFGERIASMLGWSSFMCIVASFALGIAMEEIIGKIVFSKTVQKKTANRILTFAIILLVFFAAQYIATRWMNASMLEYVEEEFGFVVALPIIGFFVSLLIRAYHIRKVRNVYGDGSKGFVFDLSKEDVEETNRQNQALHGPYDADHAAKTRTGVYVGEKEGKTIAYLGIPYALSPVGERRWKAPEPLPTSEAVFEAKNFGASAIQVEHQGSILKHHRQSEDCLYLNIWTGSEQAEGKKPVLVLFHQGDFTYGGSVDPLLHGGKFVENHPDTVFVSFNYRLGIFGFIDFSEVPGGEAYPDTLNLGLLDQIAALRWIKENVAAFGGDPARITVLGFEAGGTSVLLLAACEQAKGLFQRAFVFNGNLTGVYATPEDSRNLAKDLLKETHTATMEQLSALDSEVLKEAAQTLWQDMCQPTFDGKLLPVDVPSAYREGKASDIRFIIGFPNNQAQAYHAVLGDANYEKLVSATLEDMQNYLDDSEADTLLDYIAAQTPSADELEAKSKLIEEWNALAIYHSAVKLARGGSKVNLIYWNEKALIEKLGSGTVDMAAALLGNGDALQLYGNVMDTNLSEMLQCMLHKFIAGEPLRLYSNELPGVDAFEWKAFPRTLVISDGKYLCI